MSLERRIIDDGILCQFYGFTLTESRSLSDIERDVFIRYLNMTERLKETARKKAMPKGKATWGG